jgi:hypothetical protein
MNEKDERKHNIFLYVLFGGVLIAVASSFYFFYFKKDYNFIIETKCNPEMETCFYRDCENSLDGCPPNNLSYYNQYTIKARDFNACENEDCTFACITRVINCIKIECTQEDINNRVCVGLSSPGVQN